jgi:hypothetical protein
MSVHSLRRMCVLRLDTPCAGKNWAANIVQVLTSYIATARQCCNLRVACLLEQFFVDGAEKF